MVNEILKKLTETAIEIADAFQQENKKHYKKLYQRQYRAFKNYKLSLKKYTLAKADFEVFKKEYKRWFD